MNLTTSKYQSIAISIVTKYFAHKKDILAQGLKHGSLNQEYFDRLLDSYVDFDLSNYQYEKLKKEVRKQFKLYVWANS